MTVPVASPCTGVCRLDPATGWCLGCRRSIDEIAAWGSLDDDGRRAVLRELPRRQLPASPVAPAGQPSPGGC